MEGSDHLKKLPNFKSSEETKKEWGVLFQIIQ